MGMFKAAKALLAHLGSVIPPSMPIGQPAPTRQPRGGVVLIATGEDITIEETLRESVLRRNPKRKPRRITKRGATFVNCGRSYPAPGRVLGTQEAARRLRQLQRRRLP